ncbi:MAG: 30S ribosomal protein S16 [Chloroflexi bacterium]|nr:30S ribosomal protein S16 [Chloroflexota bacterium]
MLRIRLARRGRRGRPSYRIVVAPSKASRDGRTVSDLGYYDPLAEPSDFRVDVNAARSWIAKGAQPSDRVWKILELAEPGFRKNLKSSNGEAAVAEAPEPAPEPPAKPRAKAASKAKAKPTAKARAKSKAKAKARATRKIAPKSKTKS